MSLRQVSDVARESKGRLVSPPSSRGVGLFFVVSPNAVSSGLNPNAFRMEVSGTVVVLQPHELLMVVREEEPSEIVSVLSQPAWLVRCLTFYALRLLRIPSQETADVRVLRSFEVSEDLLLNDRLEG
jgi:hypothetical protein